MTPISVYLIVYRTNHHDERPVYTLVQIHEQNYHQRLRRDPSVEIVEIEDFIYFVVRGEGMYDSTRRAIMSVVARYHFNVGIHHVNLGGDE